MLCVLLTATSNRIAIQVLLHVLAYIHLDLSPSQSRADAVHWQDLYDTSFCLMVVQSVNASIVCAHVQMPLSQCEKRLTVN